MLENNKLVEAEEKIKVLNKIADIINDIDYQINENKEGIDDYIDDFSDYVDNVNSYNDLKDSNDEDDKEDAEFNKKEINRYEQNIKHNKKQEENMIETIKMICQSADELKEWVKDYEKFSKV